MTAQSREQQLLLLCARAHPTATSMDAVRVLAAGPIDWDHLIAMADAHAVLPCAATHLTSAAPVPQGIRERLESWLVENTARNLSRATQLAAVMRSFHDHGIGAVAWKGPTLAAAAYGHVGLRAFSDLDILVERARIRNVVGVMLARGYTQSGPTEHAFEGPVPSSWREYKFIPPAESLSCVEVHASGAPWTFAVRLETRDLIARAVLIDVGGTPIPALSPEDMLLHLAIHGADHAWSHLRMIADVDAAASMPLDWTVAVERAQAGRIGRMLAVALLLANDLLDTPLGDGAIAIARRDRTAQRLAAEFARRLFAPVHPLARHTWRDWSAWHAREHAADRLRYVVRLMVVDLGVKQWDWVRRKISSAGVTAPD